MARLLSAFLLCGGCYWIANANADDTAVNAEGKLDPDWGYTPVTSGSGGCGVGTAIRCGPDAWATQGYENCNKPGTQSPIDAPMSTAVPLAEPITELALSSVAGCTKGDFELTAHSTELLVDRTCPDSFTATWKGKPFKLKYYDWHSPSEHKVDGEFFPMEVHHVHQADDGQYLIVAVFIKASNKLEAACNANGGSSLECKRARWFQTIQTLMPDGSNPAEEEAQAGADESSRRLAHAAPSSHSHDEVFMKKDVAADVDPYTNFVPPMDTHFGYYEGSFTTPSCDTNVVWILNPTPVTIFDSSLQAYRQKIMSFPNNQLYVNPAFNFGVQPDFTWDTTLGTNNRPIQLLFDPTNNRQFYLIGKVPPEPLDSSTSSGESSGSESGTPFASVQSSSNWANSDVSGSGESSSAVSGSSGFYMGVWKWSVIAGLTCCCCVAIGVGLSNNKKKGKKAKTNKSQKQKVPEAVPEPVVKEKEPEIVLEEDPLLPPLLPLMQPGMTVMSQTPSYAMPMSTAFAPAANAFAVPASMSYASTAPGYAGYPTPAYGYSGGVV